MTTLEDAITAAKCAVEEGSQTLVIDRTLYASRKRGRLSVISRGNEKLELPNEDFKIEDSSEVAFWKDKYEKLRIVKSGNEEEMEIQLEVVAEREMKLEKYSKLLEEKIETLKMKNLGQLDKESTDKLDTYRKKLSFYETMTSMTLKCEDNGEHICTVKNRVKKVATRFKINFNDEDIQYVPIANAALLPEYLQSELSFDEHMAPVLVGDILQSLYKEDDAA
mmetsp:Transcript_19465/g.18793  ORF Transcript_19465/g.18793 Transcript_19465/m.18793 type:complete len:222 (-) Transcript_19465:35-700(-)|eukprot:CAMPEP_0119043342 /NCGR_PEP_ID=MMETSP1177-20130426/21097_1 /TAXON_ID=2985 /ORGANISM="Ochromonas sp, Strain CCMP1899" /LENGTH=221 /DNA_ID=CAMNT_0007011249 /DNA_START=264 /DNA_END=929 /DNA_ORIENTATION=-